MIKTEKGEMVVTIELRGQGEYVLKVQQAPSPLLVLRGGGAGRITNKPTYGLLPFNLSGFPAIIGMNEVP